MKSSLFWKIVSSRAIWVAVGAGIVAALSGYFGFGLVALFSALTGVGAAAILRFATKWASEIEQDETNKRISDSRRSVSTIEEKLQPRSLSDMLTLSNSLQRFTGASITIKKLDSDREVAVLARQITAALIVAGWKVTEENLPTLPINLVGIIVSVSPISDDEVIAASDSLVNQLNIDGIQSTKVSLPTGAPDVITMIIGIKP
ncbi:MAG TPA: hypothetical protein VK463_09555 [Desulfomonilaceae bacterium]|nr:hypothetical protein [Desulfomonilaceae bacterium]